MQSVARLRSLVLIGLLAALPAGASAQDISARAFLSPGNLVEVGRTFILNVEITGTQALAREPQLPDVSAYAQYLGSGTQQSMRIDNGRTTVSLTIQYRFQALAEGTFVIPELNLLAGGQVLLTKPIQVRVVAVGSATQAGAGSAAKPSGESQTREVGPEDLFVTVTPSKTRVRDGEPLVVEYRIWTRVDVTSYTFTSLPEPRGFWVEDITPAGGPEVEQLTRNGQQYASAVIRRIAIVPTGSGERTLEPLGLEAQVRVRRNDPLDNIFGRSGLFGTSTVPTTVLSEKVTLQVDPLPPGRPEPFSGVVGSLSVVTSLDRDSVATNEAVTLTVRVSGSGNIRTVPAPTLGVAADFEVFPPEISESVSASGSGLAGSKTFEFVLIPRAPGQREIPAVQMGYFDQRANAYRTATAAALPLTVTGQAPDGPPRLSRGGVAQLRQDIRFIHLGSASLRPASGFLFQGAAFWIFALLPLAGIVGATALRRHRDLLEGDIAYARGRRANKVAKKRLAEARRLAADDDARVFYAEVDRALRGLIADRLNLAEAGLKTTDLEARLAAKGAASATVSELKTCLDHCDRQRFAPPRTDSEEKARFLDRAGDLMAALDRELK